MKKNLQQQPFINGNITQEHLKEIGRHMNKGLVAGPKYLNQRILLIRIISNNENKFEYKNKP